MFYVEVKNRGVGFGVLTWKACDIGLTSENWTLAVSRRLDIPAKFDTSAIAEYEIQRFLRCNPDAGHFSFHVHPC